MTNFMFIVIVVIVLAVIILFGTVFGKQLRVKMKGRTDEVMRQDAQTPEGARDYYNAAIREKEDFYNRASASFAEISGKRSAAENDLHKTRKEIMKVTNDMNACIDSDREDEAMQYARKKSTLESKINVLKDTVDEMKEVEAHQKEIMQQAAEELQKLKEEKEQVYSASLYVRCLDGLKGGIKNETIVYYEKRPKYVNWKTDGSGNALCRGILDFKDS